MAEIEHLDPKLFWDPKHQDTPFRTSIKVDDLVYFLVNVGDGDAQIILLPENRGVRDILIVDIFKYSKVNALIQSLRAQGLIGMLSRFTLISTHPHRDHISGAARFIKDYRAMIDEVWDSAYRHTGADYDRYTKALQLVHQDPNPAVNIDVIQPTAGLTRYKGNTRITVLAPSIRIRNRYDTYGVYINDASIVLKIEFPVGRLRLRDVKRRSRRYSSLVLGGDAQTVSWANAMMEFPTLHKEKGGSRTASELSSTLERDEPLSADVLKVAHHGSKRGINFELVERIAPKLILVSCSSKSGHGFPHAVSQGLLREAQQAIAGRGGQRRADWNLGIFYTSDYLGSGLHATSKAQFDNVSPLPGNVAEPPAAEISKPLGTMAVVMSKRGVSATDHLRLWRFQDRAEDDVNLLDAIGLVEVP